MSRRQALALLPLAFVLAACGGGGGDDAGAGGDAAAREAEETIEGDEFSGDASYRQGSFSCNTSTVEMLAQDYGVKPNAKAVARAVAIQIEPNDKAKQDRAYQGCLDVLGGG